MKKHFLLILISTLLIFTFCGPKEAKVKIKAGVVMKSGDVKVLARQEFLIVKSDVVSLWETSKKENIKGLEVIKEEIKMEVGYENKINTLQKELKNHQKLLSEQPAPNSPEVKKIADDLKVHLIESHSKRDAKESTFYIRRADGIEKGKTSLKLLKVIIADCEESYGRVIKIWKERERIKSKWLERLERLKEIKKLVSNLDDKTKIERDNLFRINKNMDDLKKELKTKSTERYKLLWSKAASYFQQKLKLELAYSFMTNLNGEASLTIKKGQYYVFAIAHVGQSNLIWNHSINIEEKSHYIELSNDNAYAIDNETIYFELLEALGGLK